ncbi:MAG: sulfite exporter TauE/SafE family protein [Pseudomonadota bacterium]|nr:sulfite exporter TauE/SafE family protein [Pseudomonadota bacterium]
MDMSMDALGWAALALALLGTGVVAGVLAGLLGVGGGIVIVPVLSWLLALVALPDALTQHLAVATSLATIIPTSISSARSHRKRGSVDMERLRLWAPGVILGALAGGLVAKFASGDALRLVFGVVALLVAVNMFMPRQVQAAEAPPKGAPANWSIAGVIGLFSSMMGIGGGTLAVPIQSAVGIPIRTAVGTASALGLLIAVPGTLGFIWAGWNVEGLPPLSLGYVSLPAVALIVPATWVFAPQGAKLAHRVDQALLRRLFALFLAITAARMLWSALG